MKRALSIVAAVMLLLSISTTATNADYRTYRHWHTVNSYFYANDPMGLWQVNAYYHIKMNGSSPRYYPTVYQTQPMDCRVPYAYFTWITITRCSFGKIGYNRWSIDMRWHQCAFGINWWCMDHGFSRTIDASGHIIERSRW